MAGEVKVGETLFTRSIQFSSVTQSVWLFTTPWTAVHQAFLSITNFQSLLKFMSIESIMLSNHLIFCRPLLLPSIFPSIRVFSNESVLRIRCPGVLTCSNLCVCVKLLQSCLTLFDLWTIARQAPLSMGFSRQEYWSGLPCPPPWDLPNPGIEPRSPAPPSTE